MTSLGAEAMLPTGRGVACAPAGVQLAPPCAGTDAGRGQHVPTAGPAVGGAAGREGARAGACRRAGRAWLRQPV